MACGSDWWKEPLAQEIYSVLKLKEKNIPTYYGLTPHLFARKFLVDWLAVIREKLGLQETTYHLAVYLVDYYMEGNCDLAYSQLHLVALTCLTIAAKVEERCDCVPGVVLLNSFIPTPTKPGLPAFYHKSDYLEMELLVLKYFGWSIIKPTAAHFMPYYSSYSVSSMDLYDGMPIQSSQCLAVYIDNYADYFKDISLQYHIFRSYSPSVVASACLAASRVCLQLTPTWPERLDSVTGYCLEELLPCVHLLLKIHNKDVQEDSNQNCHK